MRRLLILGACLLVSPAIAAAPAAATTCPSGLACLWEDSGFATNTLTHSFISFSAQLQDFGMWHYSGTNISAANSASSLENNGNYEMAFFYQGAYKGTPRWYLFKKTKDGDLSNSVGNFPGGYNDKLESGYFDSYN